MTDSVQLLRALADETRLRILALLARRELCVCQIVEVLDIGQSKASRHLAHLRNVRLVSDRREGPWIHYSLAEAEGDLHRRMLQWLRQAENEIPMAASDAKALANVVACEKLCTDETSATEIAREEDVSAAIS